jgi:transposase
MEQVDRLRGTREAKRRLRVVLETVTGELSVREACERLDLSEARFHQIRQQALEGALEGLRPAAPGRPRKPEASAAPSRVEELEREVQDLRIDLQAARVRTEIALTMPHLLRDEGKKNRSKKAKPKRGGRRGRR